MTLKLRTVSLELDRFSYREMRARNTPYIVNNYKLVTVSVIPTDHTGMW